MKRLSITTKITIWYVVFLLLITVCFFAIMVYTGNMRATELAKTKLMEVVADSSEEINTFGESFIIDDDLNFYVDGVYISVYDSKYSLIEGRRPAEIAEFPDIKDKALKKIDDNEGNKWYVYDSRFDLNGKTIWVRGIVKDFAEYSTFSFMLKIAAAAFPMLSILAIIGGYVITRRAFTPVRKIIKTAEDISRDGDLSKRIEIDACEYENVRTKDEIYNLAETFNSMFDKIEESFEKEKRFTSDVSHELRTPLAVIISQSEYAREDREYSAQALEIIGREAGRMSGLVNRLLIIARSDSGKLKLNRGIINLSEMCEMVAEQQTPIAKERNIEFSFDINQGIYVYGDDAMLIRILLNLIDNSIKYSKDNGHINMMLQREMYNIGKHSQKNNEFAKISIEDDGIGISEENIDKIWERFYRVDHSRSQEGSGLGLSMVKVLVGAHDGDIKVSSIPDKGSRFDVYIPMMDINKKEANTQNEK